MACVAAARTAPGATQGSIQSSIDMDAEYGFGATHSAEWVNALQSASDFYSRLIVEFGLNVEE